MSERLRRLTCMITARFNQYTNCIYNYRCKAIQREFYTDEYDNKGKCEADIMFRLTYKNIEGKRIHRHMRIDEMPNNLTFDNQTSLAHFCYDLIAYCNGHTEGGRDCYTEEVKGFIKRLLSNVKVLTWGERYEIVKMMYTIPDENRDEFFKKREAKFNWYSGRVPFNVNKFVNSINDAIKRELAKVYRHEKGKDFGMTRLPNGEYRTWFLDFQIEFAALDVRRIVELINEVSDVKYKAIMVREVHVNNRTQYPYQWNLRVVRADANWDEAIMVSFFETAGDDEAIDTKVKAAELSGFDFPDMVKTRLQLEKINL